MARPGAGDPRRGSARASLRLNGASDGSARTAGGPSRRHPWETTRLAFFSRLARAYLPASGEVSAQDAVAGDAWFARGLLAQGPPIARIVAWDEGYDEGALRALEASAPRGIAFRRTPALQSALAEPFVSRRAFDVELLGRLLAGAPGVPPESVEGIRELPLLRWRHRAGSKIGLRNAWTIARELIAVSRDLRAHRQGRGAG